jgi:hypothetical protein
MDQKTTVSYCGKPLSKEEIQNWDFESIQELKKKNKGSDSNFIEILNGIALLTSLGCAGAVLVASVCTVIKAPDPLIFLDEKIHEPLVWLAGTYVVVISPLYNAAVSSDADSRRAIRKELDLIEYIKTGNPGEVRYKETIEKAKATGMTIG